MTAQLGIIDTDTHIMEMPDTWTSRLPASWGDQVMQIKWNEQKRRDYWYIGETPIRTAWSMAGYGWRHENRDLDLAGRDRFRGPVTQEEAHPATYDIQERVKLMDSWGVSVQVLYPNIAGFDWRPLVRKCEPKVAIAHISAYNDYQLEWVAQAPGRFIPMLVVPFFDIQASLEEIERLGDQGFGGIVMTGAPHSHGEPFLADRYWDPLWEACQDASLSVSFHVASGDTTEIHDENRRQFDLPEMRTQTQCYLENGKQIIDLLTSGILARFPRLNFVSVESGMGWVPFILEALDRRWASNQVSKHHPEYGELLPSELFHRQVFVPFWFEHLEPWHIDQVGLENLLFETDFPHPTGIYLESFEETIDLAFSGQPENVRRAVMTDNAARLYRKALDHQKVVV